MECYEDMFKEITKKLYGDGGLAEVMEAQQSGHPNIVAYDPEAFRPDGTGITLVTTNVNGTIVVQRPNEKPTEGVMVGEVGPPPSSLEERWFESEEVLSWTTSKIARFNPSQKVFRCVDCDFVGFLSRVAEHWLGNHASLRVFQCPRCPYTSAWARCVRMHLTRQHGETLTDNSLWKENPVLEEYKLQVTKFLNNLKTKVEQKGETTTPGEKRYTCPYCPYATDRRDLFNRHENIHRDEKPFQCYVCDKQFNRADHVKKHFMRMHRDHPYDINKIRKYFPKAAGSSAPFFSSNSKAKPPPPDEEDDLDDESALSDSLMLEQSQENLNQIPHIAYFNPPAAPGQTGPLQGIPGVGGTKKESKSKGSKKKKSGEKMYTCSYCPWQGVDNWCLKRHLNTHIKPFLCALCDYKAARSERLATHVLKVHNKRVCHKCSFLADDTDALSQHIQESHQNPLVKTGFNCNVCQEYFELRADLEAHAILEHQKVIVQCDLCDFRTTDELSMESHLREKHNLQPGMGAVAAAAAAAAAAAITVPGGGASNPPTIQIPEPPVESGTGGTETLIMPDVLGGAVEDHLSYGDSSGKMDGSGEGDGDTEPETLCEPCGCEFLDEPSLRIHERRHDPRRRSIMDPNTSKGISRSFICAVCSFTSPTRKQMMQHTRAHQNVERSCCADNCTFSTPFENSLKEHVLQEHNEDIVIRCPHCALRMFSLHGFTIHWRAHHCTICSLCVNLYKMKYGMKESDIHELITKSPLTLINGELDAAKTAPIVEHTDNNNEEPAIKKPRLDHLNQPSLLPMMGALSRRKAGLQKRSSLKFLPDLTDLQVTSLSKGRRARRRGRTKGEINAKRRLKRNFPPSLDQFEFIRLQENTKREGEDVRCWAASCEDKLWKKMRTKAAAAHYIWHHRDRQPFQCDICEKKFSYAYRAFLHKMKEHPQSPAPTHHNELITTFKVEKESFMLK